MTGSEITGLSVLIDHHAVGASIQTEDPALGVGASIGLYLEATALAAKMRSQPNHDEQAVLSMLRECEANIDQCVRTSASSVALDISNAIRDQRERNG